MVEGEAEVMEAETVDPFEATIICACAWVATMGADAIAATLNVTYVFEFINICYGRSDNKDDDESHL